MNEEVMCDNSFYYFITVYLLFIIKNLLKTVKLIIARQKYLSELLFLRRLEKVMSLRSLTACYVSYLFLDYCFDIN